MDPARVGESWKGLLAEHLGMRFVEAGPDRVVAEMEIRGHLRTLQGNLHGGALMALADNGGGVCAFLNLPEGAVGTATIESKTNFMRAVREGAVTASSRPLHVGRTMVVVETELVRDDGKLAAKVTQTQAFHYPR